MTRHMFRIFVAAVLVALGSGSLRAQTDIAANLYGAINKSTSATSPTSITQATANSAGVMLEVRHIFNPLIGIEATYSFHPANQHYLTSLPICLSGSACPAYSSSSTASVPAHAQQFTVDWVPSLKIGNLRPFGVAGVGVLWVRPSSGQVSVSAASTPDSTSTSTSGVYVYGAGLDWTVLPHLGLRLQYRGNIYKAPNLVNTTALIDGNTHSWTHTAEPMIGLFFRL